MRDREPTITDLPSLLASRNVVYRCIYGSNAFGLATESSDTDLRGVFILPKKQFYGLNRLEQISDERSNEVYWELDRFVTLLLKSNPNALETLAVGEEFVRHRDPLFRELSVDMFLSLACYDTFAQYAATQLRKARGLNKKIVQPVERERKGILDFCYVIEGYGSRPLPEWLKERDVSQEQCGLVRIAHIHDAYALFIGESGRYGGVIKQLDSTDVHTSSIPFGELPVATMTFNKDAYRKYCKTYEEYWSWVSHRNEARYRTNVDAGHDFDTKNMMHVFRLIGMAEDIIRKRQLVTFRPEREELLRIKRGERSYPDLVQEAEQRLATLAAECPQSDLPATPDHHRAIEALIRIRDGFYCREA